MQNGGEIEGETREPAAGFTVSWSGLNYFIERGKRKQILHDLNGHFSSGELVALMGPSGAGKTTLLESLVGIRVRGLYGRVEVKFHGGNETTSGVRRSHDRLTVSLVPQVDHLFGALTVTDSIIWASRFKNSTLSGLVDHKEVASKVIGQLFLVDCANTPVSQLSGGERKKLTIAMELVCETDVLFLDEPTSGLDSKSCYQLIKYLELLIVSLSKSGRSTAIVATIHQPPTRVFQLFKRVYFLSGGGRAIYDGTPATMLEKIERFGLSCPPQTNPADFVTEIAAGEYGQEILTALTKDFRRTSSSSSQSRTSNGADRSLHNDLTTLNQVSARTNFRPDIFLIQMWYCFIRGIILTFANRTFTLLRTIVYMCSPGVLWIAFTGEDIGGWDGCPKRSTAMLYMDYEPQEDGTPGLRELPELTKRTMDLFNLSSSCFMYPFLSMLIPVLYILKEAVLMWPIQFNVMSRERQNRWYSLGAYAAGSGLSNAPLLSVLTAMCMLTCFALAGLQMGGPDNEWVFRFGITCVLLCLMTDTIGFLISAIVPGGLKAVSFACIAMIVLSFTTKFSVHSEDVTGLVKVIYTLNPTNFLYSMFIIMIYGGDRCRCSWNYVDLDDRADWVSCLAFPDQEIDYNPICTGQNFSLTEVFRSITSYGRYDRFLCADHLAIDRGRSRPMSIGEEEALYMSQPRGIRRYKPQIYHPIPFSHMHINGDEQDAEFWWNAAYLLTFTIIGRVLTVLILYLRSRSK